MEDRKLLISKIVEESRAGHGKAAQNIDIVKHVNLNDRVELMVLDSALKGAPLIHLDQTLLLLPDKYDTALENVIVGLICLIFSHICAV